VKAVLIGIYADSNLKDFYSNEMIDENLKDFYSNGMIDENLKDFYSNENLKSSLSQSPVSTDSNRFISSSSN